MPHMAVRAVGFGWRHAGRRAWAVRELDLVIEPGERVMLLGASGSGKSTLLAALAGLLAPDEGEQAGELLIDDRSPRTVIGRAGLLFQDPDAQIVLSRIGDDVAFGCENLGIPRDDIWPRVSEALSMVGLHLPLDHPTSQLSGGQKQRLALGGILAMRPGLLLLDEPTANLDPLGVAEIVDAVSRSVSQTNSTLIVIEHRVGVWRDLVDRVVVLGSDGTILADGPTEQVLEARGQELAAAGIWVPGFPPNMPDRHRSIGGPVLRTNELVIGRQHQSAICAVPNLILRAGALTAITGANGSGKSTLALTLGGLLRPVGGGVFAERSLAADASEEPFRWKSRQLLSRIGSVFQDPEHQFLAATVRDELAIGPRALLIKPSRVDEVVNDLLDRLRLSHLAKANPFTLSGGEKRRLSVGTALATRPSALILDEPTFGQDLNTWTELAALVSERLEAGAAICVVSHDEAFVTALADETVVLTGETRRSPSDVTVS